MGLSLQEKYFAKKEKEKTDRIISEIEHVFKTGVRYDNIIVKEDNGKPRSFTYSELEKVKINSNDNSYISRCVRAALARCGL